MLSLKPLKGAKVLKGSTLQLTLGETNSSIWYFSDSPKAVTNFNFNEDTAINSYETEDY